MLDEGYIKRRRNGEGGYQWIIDHERTGVKDLPSIFTVCRVNSNPHPLMKACCVVKEREIEMRDEEEREKEREREIIIHIIIVSDTNIHTTILGGVSRK